MYKPGKWKAICDVCGFEFYNDELKKRWDNLMVCADDFEHDHPQKYLRVKQDKISVPWTRPKPEDTFVTLCYVFNSQSYADLAVANCMRADKQDFTYAQALILQAGT